MLRRILSALVRRRSAPSVAAAQVPVPSASPLEGEQLLQSGAVAEAVASFRGALARDPECVEAWYGLAGACHRAGDARLAHLYYRTALSLRPRDATILNELGLVDLEFGNTTEAESAFEQAVNADASHAHAWNNFGLAMAARGETRQACRCFKRAVSLRPGFYTALCNLGLACRQLELFDDAREALAKATALRPESTQAWLVLASVLQDEGRLDEAFDALERARRVSARDPAVLTALGDLQLRRGEPEASERALAEALEAAPGDAEARLALAHLRLAQGDFERGWPLYEARLASQSSTLRRFPVPPWDGSSYAGRSVLLYGEQGLGDEIMFSSMLPDIARDAAACRLVCHPRLRSLFARSFPAVEMLAEADALRLPADAAEFATALGSLGRVYRRRRDVFPRHQGYLLADPLRASAWRNRLQGLSAGPRIGIAWRGGLAKTGRAVRSLAPEALAPLVGASSVSWVILQPGVLETEVQRLQAIAPARVHCWDEPLADLEELAALMSKLDLVITVCSTNAHLAGALGRPTWVLTPHAPAWRYGLEGESMPWYPSARLFRQPAPGDWVSVVAAAAAALTEQRLAL